MRLLAAMLGALLLAAPAWAQSDAARQADAARAIETTPEEEEVLPDGEGRSETFGYCSGCHNTAIIRRSRFTREQWDGLMDWMAQTQGMAPLEGELRATIVDYLAKHFGPSQGRRARNPFLN